MPTLATLLRSVADRFEARHPAAPAPPLPPYVPPVPSPADAEARGEREAAALAALGVSPVPSAAAAPDSVPEPEPTPEEPTMSTAAVVTPPASPAAAPAKAGFSFHNFGHMAATGLHDFYTGIKAVETFIEKVDTPENQALVEGLTALVPVYGIPAVAVERGVFAVGGEVAAILNKLDSNGEAKLLDAGFDATVIADFKALIASVPGLVKPAAPKVG